MDWYFPILHFNGYRIHPSYLAEIIEDMWYSEPIGTLSIAIGLTGILLTFTYKILDIAWDVYKDRSRRGRLSSELRPVVRDGRAGLELVIANTGRDVIGVREVGYFEKGFAGMRFVPVSPCFGELPRVLGAKEVLTICLAATDLPARPSLCIRDSEGRVWRTSRREFKRARQELRRHPAEPESQVPEPQLS